MPKVRFATDIQSISGKLCSKEGVIYSVNKQTGETYRSDRHSFNDANTERQQQHRADFKKKSQFARLGGSRTAHRPHRRMARMLTLP